MRPATVYQRQRLALVERAVRRQREVVDVADRAERVDPNRVMRLAVPRADRLRSRYCRFVLEKVF